MQYVDYGFTSGMEGQLDEVCGGELPWRRLLGEFWGPFSRTCSEVLGGLSVTQVLDALNASVGDQLIGQVRERARVGTPSPPEGSGCARGGGWRRCAAPLMLSSMPPTLPTLPRAQDRSCPVCQLPLSLKLAKSAGPFVGCTGYPSACAQGGGDGEPQRA